MPSDQQNPEGLRADDVFLGLPALAIEQLGQVKRDLRETGEPSIFTYRLAQPHIDRNVQDWKTVCAAVAADCTERTTVYYMQLTSVAQDAQLRVQAKFREALEGRVGRPRDNQRCSPVLYVGSSRNMRTRLREHLGFGAAKTYALKLADWYPAEEMPVELVCAIYPPMTPPLAIAALEDALWARLNPMFGRKGAR